MFNGQREGVSEGSPRSSEPGTGGAEMRALREGKFRDMLNALSDSVISDEAYQRVLKGSFDDGRLPELSGEEMRALAEKIAPALHETSPAIIPERYKPEDDVYEAMGSRRATFEKSFAANLGRPVTPEDMAMARALFAADTDIQNKWSTLVGEEVAHYARQTAETMREAKRDSAAA